MGEEHELLDILIFDRFERIFKFKPFDTFHPLLLSRNFGVVESFDEVNLGSHEDELVDTAILEMDFAQPSQNLDVEEARFLADLADRSLFRGLAGLDVALRNGPATLGILDEQDFDIAIAFTGAKNDTAGGWLAHDLLDSGFFENARRETRDGVGALLFVF